MDKVAAIKALERDERATFLPFKRPFRHFVEMLHNAIAEALENGYVGNIDRLIQEKLREMVDAAVELAYLKGGRRAQLAAEKVVHESPKEYAPVQFSLQDTGTERAKGTIAYLRRVSGLNPSQAKTQFQKQTAGAIGHLADEICSEVTQTMMNLTEKGIHVRGGKQAILQSLQQQGVGVLATAHLAETLFRTQSMNAYAAGRWNVVNDPDIGKYIWGFEYVTVGDDRVREGHRLLEGVRLPKEDPFWHRYFPPNGWNCRCSTLEIWQDDPEAKIHFGITGKDPRKRPTHEMNVPPDFRGNPGMVAGVPTRKKPEVPAKKEVTKVETQPVTSQKFNNIVACEREIARLVKKWNADHKGLKNQKIVHIRRVKGIQFEVKATGWEVLHKGARLATVGQLAVGGFRISGGGQKVDVATVTEMLARVRRMAASKLGTSEELLLLEFDGGNIHISPPVSEVVEKEVFTEIQHLGGSTGAKLVQSSVTGKKYVQKTGGMAGNDPVGHLQNEMAADSFYRAMGIQVPEFQEVTEDGKLLKRAEFIENGVPLGNWWRTANKSQREKMLEKLRPGFDVDVLLGNWDVIGLSTDNILIDTDGNPWRIDNGGALGFRAQGAKKATDAWESGWPDDLWTMRDPAVNPQCAKFFGNISTYDLVHSIAHRDWTKAIETLSENDKVVVQKRLKEIRELAERTEPFKNDGCTDETIETVLKRSYDLSKEGFREAVPDITLDSHGTPQDFGFFRSNIRQQFTSANIPGQSTDDSSQWAGIILEAYKTVNFHISQGHDSTSYNWGKINLAMTLKPKLEAMVAAGETKANYYLACLTELEKKSKMKKSKKPLPNINLTIPLPIYTPPAPQVPTLSSDPPEKKYSSLTDWIFSGMTKDEQDVIAKWQKAQGDNSYYPDACKFKIARLLSQGITTHKEAENRGYYVGIENHPGEPGTHYRAVSAAFDFFTQNPDKKELYISAYAKYQSGISLILENSDFPGNDRNTRTIVLMRTENRSIFGGKVPKIGKLSHNRGVNESHSIFKTVRVEGSVLTMVRVPYHRISGTYFLERTPKESNKGCFLGDNENEFNADTHGLDVFCVHDKEVPGGLKVSRFRKVFDRLEKKDKNP